MPHGFGACRGSITLLDKVHSRVLIWPSKSRIGPPAPQSRASAPSVCMPYIAAVPSYFRFAYLASYTKYFTFSYSCYLTIQRCHTNSSSLFLRLQPCVPFVPPHRPRPPLCMHTNPRYCPLPWHGTRQRCRIQTGVTDRLSPSRTPIPTLRRTNSIRKTRLRILHQIFSHVLHCSAPLS